MSGLVLLVATWNCWISYKNGYAGLLVLHLLPLMNPWLIVEMQPVSFFSIGITSELAELVPIPFFEGGLLVILKDCMIFLSPFLDITWMSTVSYLAQLDSGILCL